MEDKIQTILLKAKEDVYSHLSGEKLSKFLGQGYDFAELREYEHFDDIRHISWINSAKLGKPYVKKMYEERELNIAICSLLDGRFLQGSKRELLFYIMAVLAYSTYESNDLLSLIEIEEDVKILETSNNLYIIDSTLKKLYSRELLGKKIDYLKLSSLELPKKQLLFLVGDFLDFVDLSLLAQEHEVVVVIIRDKLEESPKPLSDVTLVDPQSNLPLNQVLNQKSIEHYRSKFLEHEEQLMQHFYEHHIKYIKVYNEDEVLEKLEMLFFN